MPIQRTSAQSDFLQMRIRALKFYLFPSQLHWYISATRVHLIISSKTSCISAVTLNSSTTSYHLTELKEKTTYRVQISGFTNAGEGPLTLSQPFSTPKYGTVEPLCICITQHVTLLYALSMLTHKIYYFIFIIYYLLCIIYYLLYIRYLLYQ